MKHIQEIRALVRLLWKSNRFHCLIIQSPPGWGKSSAISQILRELGVPFQVLGSYTTPLGLYRSLQNAPNILHVMDDCAGVSNDLIAVSILKAATWESSGSENQRWIRWNSSTSLNGTEGFSFQGKIILLVNHLPSGVEVSSLVSRSLRLSFGFGLDETRRLLREASENVEYFPDGNAARLAANYLCANLHRLNEREINLRTLSLAYELVQSSPEDWESVLSRLLPRNQVDRVVQELRDSGKSVKEQIEEFLRRTGKSRRTFFYHKRATKERF